MGGQSGQAVAVELIAVLAIVEVILFSSIRQAAESADRGVLLRTIGSFGCLVAEQAGALILFRWEPNGSVPRRHRDDVLVHLHGSPARGCS